MNNNKTLTEVLSTLPQNSKITYVHKPTKENPTKYILTAKGFTSFYLNNQALPNLTPEEQLILLNSTHNMHSSIAKQTLAGIFKARKFKEASANLDEAIQNCNAELVKENRAWLDERATALEQISQNNMRASQLQYYLDLEKTMAKYNKKQKSKLVIFSNIKNKILQFITRKPFAEPPVTQEELDEGKKVWQQFREEQNAPNSLSNQALLKQYKYKSNISQGEPFSYLLNTHEQKALFEEYTCTNIALQILDGSALLKATTAIQKNPFQYLKKFKPQTIDPQTK